MASASSVRDSASALRDGSPGAAAHASGSRGTSGTAAGAARGDPGDVRQEAQRSIPIQPRRSTVAPFLQPSLSASSATASSHQQVSLCSLCRNATGFELALLQSAPSTLIRSRSAYRLRLLHAFRRTHPPAAAIRAARLSARLEAAQHLPKRSSLPSSRLLCLPLSGAVSLPPAPESNLPPTPDAGC